jgi:hypothetical protein
MHPPRDCDGEGSQQLCELDLVAVGPTNANPVCDVGIIAVEGVGDLLDRGQARTELREQDSLQVMEFLQCQTVEPGFQAGVDRGV